MLPPESDWDRAGKPGALRVPRGTHLAWAASERPHFPKLMRAAPASQRAERAIASVRRPLRHKNHKRVRANLSKRDPVQMPPWPLRVNRLETRKG